MVKVRELVHGNLTLNLWWETSYSSGICAADKQREARWARGQYGSNNPPNSKVVKCSCVCVRMVFACILLREYSLKNKHNFFYFFLYALKLEMWVCVFPLCVRRVEAQTMSCSVCVWLTPWSPFLIAGSTGCRHMPIFIGSWIKPLRCHL